MNENNTSKQQIQVMKDFIRRYRLVLIIVVTLSLVVFEIGYAGNIAYGVKWMSCRERPVLFEQWNSSYFGVQPLNIQITRDPGFFKEKTFFFNENYRLYCNLKEAEDAASRIPYSVTHKNY